MENLNITIFDIIVAVVIALSVIVALSRGFIKELFSIAAWVGAGAVTYYFFTPILPIVQETIPQQIIAEAITAFVLFVVPLILFRVVAGIIANALTGGGNSGMFDRFLGLGFGLARGALLVAAGYIILSIVMPPERQPDWVNNAYSIGYVQEAASLLQDWLPEGLIEQGTAEANRAIDGANELRDLSDGLSSEGNDAIGQIIEQVQQN